jgi:arylformamidase
VDEVALDATLGPARVIAIRDRRAIREEELRAQRIRAGERILFRTANSRRAWAERPFDPSFVHLTEGAARYLASRQVRTVGVDYLSVGGFQEEAHGDEVHRILLRAGILIIEGLDLRRIRPGPYALVCLPLRLAHGDGAPARVVLKPAGRRASNPRGGPQLG